MFKHVISVCAALLLAFSVSAAEKKVVYYRDFGAKGDGKTNDLEAIFKAHEYANKHGLPVKADDNAVYLLEDGPAPVVIKTDVDWGKAKFIVNDLAENLPNFRKALFHVQSSRKEYDIKDLKPLKRGQKNVGIKLPGRALILVVDKTTKRYIRYGANANKGSDQGETILVNKNGDIDPATPVIWDYKTISKATVFPVDEKLLTVKGGDFTTYTNNRKGKHVYFGRGIAVTRSNTLIQGVIHRVIEPEGIDSWPYTGFLNVGKCAEVTFKDCKVTGRKVYSYPIPGQKKRKTTGTYDISGNNAVKINYINVVQINDFMDPVYWGVMGTNFCKSVLLDGCKVSRFDAHQGVTNAIIRNSQLGYQGINAIGFGTFLVENSVSYGSRLINFRADYGAMWNGDFIIRNCKFVPGNAYNLCLFGGPATPQHDFGYPCMMPETITIDGLEVDMSKVKRSKFLAVFGDFDRQNKNPESEQPYIFTKTLNVKKFTCNGPVKLAHKPEQFKNTKVNGKLPK
ncbi:MAG: hypothetical protein IJC34_03455 [Lentisphaeria bacterium]|nr:hypothetical protein [Lentisphaeria bacterium]MBQ7394249.1 hypothetical protein [Lentisphaeria bacterium]